MHMIDNLGGRLGSFDRLEKELPAGEQWSAYDKALGGGAYFAAAGRREAASAEAAEQAVAQRRRCSRPASQRRHDAAPNLRKYRVAERPVPPSLTRAPTTVEGRWRRTPKS